MHQLHRQEPCSPHADALGRAALPYVTEAMPHERGAPATSAASLVYPADMRALLIFDTTLNSPSSSKPVVTCTAGIALFSYPGQALSVHGGCKQFGLWSAATVQHIGETGPPGERLGSPG